MKAERIRCDIFCRVVDNFGDAAVCWRLATQLVSERGWSVRLWIDDPSPLTRLAPDYCLGAVSVRNWACAAGVMPAQVVIEAFACALPEPYIEAMARCAPVPVWLNLEYLSAEGWIEDCHALPSPHPRLPLTKFFFFPGFSPASGGLLREADHAARRAAFEPDAFRAEFGIPPTTPGHLTISLFSYPNPALSTLLDQWAASPTPILALRPGSTEPGRQIGNLTLLPLPFLEQAHYDELLWTCDLNFVRGEDSFVRAQLAGKPLIWHIYPQADGAHWPKLDAFLSRYAKASLGGTAPGAAMSAFTRAWNGAGTPDWENFAPHLAALSHSAWLWFEYLAELPDLANNLADFCRKKLK